MYKDLEKWTNKILVWLALPYIASLVLTYCYNNLWLYIFGGSIIIMYLFCVVLYAFSFHHNFKSQIKNVYENKCEETNYIEKLIEHLDNIERNKKNSRV